MIKKFEKFESLSQPKFKSGDRCMYIGPLGGRFIVVYADDFIIGEEPPYWEDHRKPCWFYHIVDKSNDCPEYMIVPYEEGKTVVWSPGHKNKLDDSDLWKLYLNATPFEIENYETINKYNL